MKPKSRQIRKAYKIYKKAVEKSEIRKEFFKVCRNRDWISLIAIVEFICLIILTWMLYIK